MRIAEILKLLFPSTEDELLEEVKKAVKARGMKIVLNDSTGLLAEGLNTVIIATRRGGGVSFLIFRDGKPHATFASDTEEVKSNIEKALGEG